ncbi:MAG: hypothetical protein ABI182_05015 [Candidatus Baltobacteraceae bacterium]
MIDYLEAARELEAFTDVLPLLERIVRAYGQANVAAMLGADKSAVSLWLARKRAISAPMRARALELHDVVTRTHQVFNPILAVRWLFGHEPLLGGARPIDVMAVRGSSEVIDARDAIAAGGFV